MEWWPLRPGLGPTQDRKAESQRPIKYEVVGSRVVVPGLCIEATIRKRGNEARARTWIVQSLYLPPDDRRAATIAYVEAIGREGEALYVGSDLDLQVHRPRNDEEQDDAIRLCEAWQRMGLLPSGARAPYAEGRAATR